MESTINRLYEENPEEASKVEAQFDTAVDFFEDIRSDLQAIELGQSPNIITNTINSIINPRAQTESVPTIIIAGKEYGSGSSRDWAAKGPKLQGVAAVLTESFERIHRSNLVGMGILPLQFKDGENADTYNINGTEEFTISGIKSGEAKTVKITADNGIERKSFEVNVRIDTPQEVKYFKSGGILQYVLKQIAA